MFQSKCLQMNRFLNKISFTALALFIAVSVMASNPTEEKKQLIINADDYGMCHSFNVAIQEMLLHEGLTSASIMVPCPWFAEAAQFCRENPNLGVGVHLTLTSEWEGYKWRPVTSNQDVSSLVDEQGYFYSNHDDFMANAKDEHIRIELRNQIQMALDAGININHLNDHMGALSMMGPEKIQIALDLMNEFKLPYRMTDNLEAGFMLYLPEVSKQGMSSAAESFDTQKFKYIDMLMTNSFTKVEGQSYEQYRDEVIGYLKQLPAGITEYFVHPSVESEEIKHISKDWEQRVFEYRVFSDPLVKKVIEEEGIELVDYSILNQ